MSGITMPSWHKQAYPRTSAPATPHALSRRRGMIPVLIAAAGVLLLAAAIAVSWNGTASLFGLGGLVIVFGGVTVSAFMTFRPEDVRAAMGSVVAMLTGAQAAGETDLRRDVEDLVGWARVAFGQGMRALEHSAAHGQPNDPFVSYGLNLVVSDYTPNDVRAMLEIAVEANYEREHAKVDVLSTMASHAPAFGMVGTLIGMIAMLHDMNGGSGAIGGMLAVAFLSTLYGVVSARVIYMPAATRLARQVEARRLRDSMVTEGMVMLAARKSPAITRDRLSAFLHPRMRSAFDSIDALADAAHRLSPDTTAEAAGVRRMLKVVTQ